MLGADGRYFADAAALAEAIDDAEADPDGDSGSRSEVASGSLRRTTAGTTSPTPTRPYAAGSSRVAASTAPSAAAAPAPPSPNRARAHCFLRVRASGRNYPGVDQ